MKVPRRLESLNSLQGAMAQVIWTLLCECGTFYRQIVAINRRTQWVDAWVNLLVLSVNLLSKASKNPAECLHPRAFLR